MRLNVINVANKMPAWIIQGCDEYLKRINAGKYSCKIIEVKAAKNPNKPTQEIMAEEADKIKTQIPQNSYVIALDEKGVALSSKKFAAKLEQVSLHNPSITFIIGGADGLDSGLKQSSDMLLQLSDLTYPHALVRVIILEQIYRAISILENHPYHRE